MLFFIAGIMIGFLISSAKISLEEKYHYDKGFHQGVVHSDILLRSHYKTLVDAEIRTNIEHDGDTIGIRSVLHIQRQ